MIQQSMIRSATLHHQEEGFIFRLRQWRPITREAAVRCSSGPVSLTKCETESATAASPALKQFSSSCMLPVSTLFTKWCMIYFFQIMYLSDFVNFNLMTFGGKEMKRITWQREMCDCVREGYHLTVGWSQSKICHAHWMYIYKMSFMFWQANVCDMFLTYLLCSAKLCTCALLCIFVINMLLWILWSWVCVHTLKDMGWICGKQLVLRPLFRLGSSKSK